MNNVGDTFKLDSSIWGHCTKL